MSNLFTGQTHGGSGKPRRVGGAAGRSRRKDEGAWTYKASICDDGNFECTSHSSCRADFLAPQQVIIKNSVVCTDAAAHTCTTYFPKVHALLTFFFPGVHTTRSAAWLCRGGGRRPPTIPHSRSSKRRLEQDAPRTRPVAPASDVYCPDSSGQTLVKRVHFSPLCTKKHKFRFSLPCTETIQF